MKWRKLLELSTSSTPRRRNTRAGQSARRRAIFESLENRKLFAIDLAEVTTAELISSDPGSIEDLSIEMADLAAVKFDETAEVIIDPAPAEFDALHEPSELMLMTFRSNATVDSIEMDKDVATDPYLELDSYMIMTIDSTDMDALQVRVLDEVVDLSVTNVPVDEVFGDSDTVDGTISDEDLMFYTMGPGPEIETTSTEEPTTVEDVNGDGLVTPLDMLLVINVLNGYGFQAEQLSASSAAPVEGNWDINRDGHVTPLDALWLTNYFNSDASIGSAFAATETSRIAYPRGDEPIIDESMIDEPFVDAPLADERIDEDLWG